MLRFEVRFWIHVRFSTAKKKKKQQQFWRFLIISRGMWDSNPFAAHKDVSRKIKNTTVKQENQERNENSWNNITDTSKSIPEHWRVDHWPQRCVYLRVSITQTIQRLNDNSPGGINRQTHSTNKFKQKHCLGLSCDSYRREEKINWTEFHPSSLIGLVMAGYKYDLKFLQAAQHKSKQSMIFREVFGTLIEALWANVSVCWLESLSWAFNVFSADSQKPFLKD